MYNQEVAFRASMALVKSAIEGDYMFTGMLASCREERFMRFCFGLSEQSERTRTEVIVKNALGNSFAHLWVVAIAFCGAGRDTMLVAVGVQDESAASEARQALMDVDHRAMVSYPRG